VALTSYEVLEVDAIVIMGILILVTFLNTVTDDSTEDIMKNKGFELLLQREKTEAFLQKCDDKKLDNSDINSKLMSECDDMKIKLLEIDAEFTALNNTARQLFEFVPEYEITKTYKESPEWFIFWGFIFEPIHRLTDVSFWSAILIFPFAISAAYESIISRKKEKNDASEIGLNLMIAGFILLFPLLLIVVMSS